MEVRCMEANSEGILSTILDRVTKAKTYTIDRRAEKDLAQAKALQAKIRKLNMHN